MDLKHKIILLSSKSFFFHLLDVFAKFLKEQTFIWDAPKWVTWTQKRQVVYSRYTQPWHEYCSTFLSILLRLLGGPVKHSLPLIIKRILKCVYIVYSPTQKSQLKEKKHLKKCAGGLFWLEPWGLRGFTLCI